MIELPGKDDMVVRAVRRDRERISQELHDGAIQVLFAVGLELQADAEATVDRRLAPRLMRTADRIDEVIRDLRAYIVGLRPAIVADRTLDQALHQLALELERTGGVTTVVDIDGQVAVALEPHAADLAQIAREALSNVRRHSGASTCRVRLSGENGTAIFEVEDDGAGLDPAATRAGGQGLRNMRDRASALGGTLDVRSADPGALLRVMLPLPHPAPGISAPGKLSPSSGGLERPPRPPERLPGPMRSGE